MKSILMTPNLILLIAAAIALSGCGRDGASSTSASVSPNPAAQVTPPTPAPTPTVPTLNSWSDPFPAPMMVADCFSDPDVNLCLTYKDPVTLNGAKFVTALTPKTARTADETVAFSYGVKVPTTAPSNDDFRIDTTPPASAPGGAPVTRVALTSKGDWKYHYHGDSNHNVAQLNTWYWVNRERSYFEERTGIFYLLRDVTGQKTILRPYARIQDNAFFDMDEGSLNIGFADGGLSSSYKANEADLGVEPAVLAHELGHGNFNAATGDAGYGARACPKNTNSTCCSSTRGCFSAIHEGVGDLHAAFLFPDQRPTILVYGFNDIAGDPERDLVAAQSKTVQHFYNLLGSSTLGEVHAMGTIYASIWYAVWTKQSSDAGKKDIETLFFEHLATLSPSDDFITAYDTIKELATSLDPARAVEIQNAFRVEYQRLYPAINFR